MAGVRTCTRTANAWQSAGLVAALWIGGTFATAASAQAEPADLLAPGAVLSELPLTTVVLPAGAADTSTRIRYSTLRTATDPGESTGSVFLPQGTPPAGGWPVVSYAHGNVGIDDACAPSVTGSTEVERASIEQWLAAGYAVAATDYAGIGTDGVNAYTDGPAAGANAVDIVRAAHHIYGDQLGDRWIVAGLSQGGHAAYFAAHQATTRSPELDFRGAIAVGAPTHLDQLLPLAGPNFPPVPNAGIAQYVLYTLAGLDDQRPQLDIRRRLTPTGVELIEKAKVTCNSEYDEYLRTNPVTIAELFTTPLDSPDLRAVLQHMQQAPTSGFDRPIRVVHSLTDTKVPIPLTWAQLSEMRSNGVDTEYQQLSDVDHSASLTAAMPESLAFAARVLR
ncbi:alpha/beta hydrolase family protein [Rhodococcus sp. WAY2]|uniref:alpha/beta hydrolase family protein n=1 Tax=Rhodococcus sp. WAY2 TaxID=2663121 RepID=UPI00131FF759|nr:lipase family protein [Rhodococcus sp. WAY2]QHE73488.1 putative exported lipase [Rhodococcus sp. WAY2]